MRSILDNHNYQIAAWACVAILVAGLIWETVAADWSGAIFVAVFLAASVIFLLQRKRLPTLFSLLFTLAALLNAAGWVFNFWDKVPGWDPVAHAFTTFAGALAVGFLVFHSTALHFREHSWSYAISIAAYGLALGGLWEVFEWVVGVEQTYQSVVVDLVMDSLGGILAGGFAAWAIRTQPREQLAA